MSASVEAPSAPAIEWSKAGERETAPGPEGVVAVIERMAHANWSLQVVREWWDPVMRCHRSHHLLAAELTSRRHARAVAEAMLWGLK